jgi:hypothetical protein
VPKPGVPDVHHCVLSVWANKKIWQVNLPPLQMCRDLGFQTFTTVSFLPTNGFSVRDADNQARIFIWG